MLFCLDPETAHYATLNLLKLAHTLKLTKFFKKKSAPLNLMGLEFKNPVGLAAGLDKNGDYIDALGDLGFGFIEIGTVTPRPQPGNPRPRLFRLTKQQALINRMGFNNKGLDYVVARLKKSTYRGILGVNIGKNFDTPLEKATEDYLLGFNAVAQYASYVTINISSPNTTGLRDLQHGELLRSLLQQLKHAQQHYFQLNKKYVPLVVKIAPDLTSEELSTLAHVLLQQNIDGVIATNTTLSREGIEDSLAQEKGGLSGKPLCARSTETIKQLYAVLQDKIPIIGCGGIFSHTDAEKKFAAGARAIQLYSGLIYQGPALIKKCMT